MKISRGVLAGIVALSFAFVCLSCEKKSLGDRSLENIQEKGTLILGLDDSFPPMGYRNEAGEIVGFDIDLARSVCQRLGVTLVTQPISWDAKEMELSSGAIDCIWNGLTITEERQRAMTFTSPYLRNEQVVLAKKGVVTSQKDLVNKKIGVQSGSTGADAYRASDLNGHSSLVEYADYLTAILDLQAGGIDAIVLDSIVANAQVEAAGAKGKLEVVPNLVFAEESYGIAFRKKDIALAKAVDSIVSELNADGTTAKISMKWFKKDLSLTK